MSGWNWGDTISGLIGASGLVLAWRTYYVQNSKEEVIVYPYQEKHGEYGIAIENIGKATAVGYTFKVSSYDDDTTEQKKEFLDSHKLLNREAEITLATGKIHKIRIGDQGSILEEIRVIDGDFTSRLRKEGEYPTLEIEILKRNGRNYTVVTHTICDFKAFEDYPYTSDPLVLLQHQIDRDNRLARDILRVQSRN
ncbi:hypothetical protein [Exiguobacterium sp. s22]|uniref:hypothetical protein n=1 Tax=Exiguobacterium sp. s22 TaxID=2751272 RepID=UPI001BECC8DD|nr:hypothetical protein [Exiguobacterium sp. s22]